MSTPANNKKRLECKLDPMVREQLDRWSHHHSGIHDVAFRFADYCGNQLRFHGVNFVEKVILEALAILKSNVHVLGIAKSYEMYCRHILNQLPTLFDYKVDAICYTHTKLSYTWDCVKHGYFDWLFEGNLDPATVTVTYAPAEHHLNKQLQAFLLAHHIFTRNDLQHLGLASEQNLYTDEYRPGGTP